MGTQNVAEMVISFDTYYDYVIVITESKVQISFG